MNTTYFNPLTNPFITPNSDRQLYVTDPNFNMINILDDYESFIWTDRYDAYGDFEYFNKASYDVITTMKKNYYIFNTKTDHVMIIESIKTETDVEDGNHITVSGRSLESILDRRIVWKLTNVKGPLQDCIEKLLNENIISPSIPERKIPNFIFKRSDDEYINKLQIEAQFTGDSIYTIVTNICIENGLGFKITVNKNKQFVFTLYRGIDRSGVDPLIPTVTFSPSYDNIIDSNFCDSIMDYKNVALIAGEEQAEKRRYSSIGDATGIDRRELFVDARDISSVDENDKTISEKDYNNLLNQRGTEYLVQSSDSTAFDTSIDTTVGNQYDVDYFMGDVVHIEDAFGITAPARIIEWIYSDSTSGSQQYPTFVLLL